jgi:hypothetical protein
MRAGHALGNNNCRIGQCREPIETLDRLLLFLAQAGAVLKSVNARLPAIVSELAKWILDFPPIRHYKYWKFIVPFPNPCKKLGDTIDLVIVASMWKPEYFV